MTKSGIGGHRRLPEGARQQMPPAACCTGRTGAMMLPCDAAHFFQLDRQHVCECCSSVQMVIVQMVTIALQPWVAQTMMHACWQFQASKRNRGQGRKPLHPCGIQRARYVHLHKLQQTYLERFERGQWNKAALFHTHTVPQQHCGSRSQ